MRCDLNPDPYPVQILIREMKSKYHSIFFKININIHSVIYWIWFSFWYCVSYSPDFKSFEFQSYYRKCWSQSYFISHFLTIDSVRQFPMQETVFSKNVLNKNKKAGISKPIFWRRPDRIICLKRKDWKCIGRRSILFCKGWLKIFFSI